MSTILAFVPRTDASVRSPRSNQRPPEIIIFPGVRYERLETSALDGRFQQDAELLARLPAPPHN